MRNSVILSAVVVHFNDLMFTFYRIDVYLCPFDKLQLSLQCFCCWPLLWLFWWVHLLISIEAVIADKPCDSNKLWQCLLVGQLKSNQIYWSNTTAPLGASNHIKYELKEHGSQGWEGNRRKPCWVPEWANWLFSSGVYSTRWEVSQRRLLSSGVRDNCGGATWSRVLKDLAPLVPRKILPVASLGDRGVCCRPRWGLREAGDVREKRYSVDD